jgi:hypothetical protein
VYEHGPSHVCRNVAVRSYLDKHDFQQALGISSKRVNVDDTGASFPKKSILLTGVMETPNDDARSVMYQSLHETIHHLFAECNKKTPCYERFFKITALGFGFFSYFFFWLVFTKFFRVANCSLFLPCFFYP